MILPFGLNYVVLWLSPESKAWTPELMGFRGSQLILMIGATLGFSWVRFKFF
jgi:hypothetical protein